MNTKTVVKTALLTAAALIMFFVEARIPNPVPIQGVKLGLANIFVVYALYAINTKSAATLLLCKTVLGGILAGSGIGILYSAVGGMFCFLAMLGMKKALDIRQLWVCSVIGAVGHNAGQLLVAVGITQTWQVLAYAPILAASGIITGIFTGVAAQCIHARLVRLRQE